ncbi:MAG: tetratricopeptide repeat protein [Cyanomargarita calcarea GSE-NOS-MK-12-04C]|jgi:tetratricopeptide (TPR) repeat protein|uniref:Tetratricopeptide repeat protein n=1 Tax=Cyanomargarita calcarea GSE-NOS-MK-12-04C TaxID=2839659 RepID=A0A951UTV3_9CYAN|nr:tetratricopeptide repeat protein [Cyanomargarita calcarea GSE-NOS-MK-12-04C]
MDWTTPLRSLQSDFIKRLTSGCLLLSEADGLYSELTIIRGERLKALREFCWQMAEKYKRTSPVREVFISNLKGKLGEEVVKERLADLITEVDYEKRFGGDGKVDFTLTANASIGIDVKSRHGSFDKVRWSVSAEEVEKNAVVVCILIQEVVNEAQSEYHLFFAGFLPTQMIKLRTGKISFGIEQLLYGGGLKCYLEELQSASNGNYHGEKYQREIHKQRKYQLIPEKVDNWNLLYLKLGDECVNKKQYQDAITAYSHALQIQPRNADIYYKRGNARYSLREYEGAIPDYIQAININPNYAKAYNQSASARYELGDYQGAIEDYTQAIKINPNDALAYRNRANVRSQIGDNQGAIEDFTHAIKINPHDRDTYRSLDKAGYLLKDKPQFAHDADAYKKRANSRYELGNYEGAIEDYTQMIDINPNDAFAYKNRANVRSYCGDYQGAIDDYTQTIKINFNDADAYYHRGNIRCELGDKLLAIEDFQKATDLYRKEGKLVEQKNVQERILELEIEDSLDILNF